MLDTAPTIQNEPDLLGSLHLGFDSLYAFQPLQPQADALTAGADGDGSSCIDDEALVNLYYSYFHRSHPFLVPRHLYHLQKYPRYLRLAVQFVGSHYSTTISADTLREATGRAVADTSQRTVAMVQANIMFAVALHARHELPESEMALSRAVQLALELGMHRREFPLAHGARSAVEEESMRRTWWELFVVDGYLAALHHKSSFRTGAVPSDALLPCEEAAYAEGGECLPAPLSLAQFDARLFADDELPFSSFCYRIDAVRILSRVLAVGRSHEAHRDEVEAVDNALAGWAHHLHPSKSEIVSDRGALDEMLFQAHMIVQYASMVLHCPRSDLVLTLPAAARISCGQSDGHVAPVATQHAHAVKATAASAQLSGLAALRAPVRKHTPFFVCALLLSATVQLAACATRPVHCRLFRDSVALTIGVLKSLGQTWALAHNALRLIRDVAAEVLQQQQQQQQQGPPPRPAAGAAVLAEDDGVDARAILDGSATSESSLDGFQDLIQPDQWVLPLMLQIDHNHNPSGSRDQRQSGV